MNRNVSCCKEDGFCPQVCITPTSIEVRTICATLMACWLFGCLGLGLGQGWGLRHVRQAPPCLLFSFAAVSSVLRLFVPWQLCQPASSDTDSTSRLPRCQHDDSAALPRLPASSFLSLNDTPCSSSSVFSFSPSA